MCIVFYTFNFPAIKLVAPSTLKYFRTKLAISWWRNKVLPLHEHIPLFTLTTGAGNSKTGPLCRKESRVATLRQKILYYPLIRIFPLLFRHKIIYSTTTKWHYPPGAHTTINPFCNHQWNGFCWNILIQPPGCPRLKLCYKTLEFPCVNHILIVFGKFPVLFPVWKNKDPNSPFSLFRGNSERIPLGWSVRSNRASFSWQHKHSRFGVKAKKYYLRFYSVQLKIPEYTLLHGTYKL